MTSKEWDFTHSLLKSMVLNTAICSTKLLRGSDFMKRNLRDIENPEIKKIYAGIIRSMVEWRKNNWIPEDRENTFYGCLIIAMSLMEHDHVYHDLFKSLIKNLDETQRISIEGEMKNIAELKGRLERVRDESRESIEKDIELNYESIRKKLLGDIQEKEVHFK